MTSRLGQCEVCDQNVAKYTCPQCEVKTCCVTCINIHKKELECSGIRNRVKYKLLQKFSNLDFQNDYMLLEEIGRFTSQAAKGIGHKKQILPLILHKLKKAAERRRVRLYFLPFRFSRHKNNTTFLDWKTDTFYWKIQWIFPYADFLECVDERVLDTETVGKTVSKYLDPDLCESLLHERLRFYHSKELDDTTLLLKAEQRGPDKYYIIHHYETVREALASKVIIEHPIIYVIYSDHLDEYATVFTDDENEPSNEGEDKDLTFFRSNSNDESANEDADS